LNVGSSKSSVIGYQYSMDVHMGVCRGPVDQVAEVRVGDRTAVALELSDDASPDTLTINKPELFGGKEREGGVIGSLRYMMGGPLQIVPDAIKTMLGGLVSNMRGVLTVYYSGVIATNNPYPKPWAFRVRRALSGWDGNDPWYPAKARIWMGDTAETKVMGMNPAHIIWECLTNRAWGRGFSSSVLDEASFTAAANKLCDEGFGLCLKWARKDDLDAFVRSVINHIGGALYVDRSTGLWTIRLIRDDYDPGDVPIYDFDSGLLAIEEDESGASDTAFNEIIVDYMDPVRKQTAQVRVHDSAAFAAHGAIRSKTQSYLGLPTAALALRVAQRDLAAQTQQLRRFKLRFDRSAWNIPPASVIAINVPTRGISNLFLRVGRVEDSALTTGEIIISAVQDVFGLPATSYTEVVNMEWTPPPTTVGAATARLYEANWQDLSSALSAADLAQFDGTESSILVYAKSPGALALEYKLETRVAAGAWTEGPTAAFTTAIVTTHTLDPDTTGIDCDPILPTSRVPIGESARIVSGTDEEIIQITAYNDTTGVMTVKRGCADTPPRSWDIGAEVAFYGEAFTTDAREYTSGEAVDARTIARSTSAASEGAAAPIASLTTANRLGRPYPPGDVQVNGEPFWAPPAPDPGMWPLVLSWVERNRLTQADQLVGHFEGTTTPEVGTTYTLRIYNNVTDALIRTVSAIATTTTSYDEPAVTGDPVTQFLRMELTAVRGGVESFHPVSFVVEVDT